MIISAILCTHNPREDYLERTLHSLAQQNLAGEEWELIVVDNGSKIPICRLPGWNSRITARIIREETPGLTPARLRGIRESRGLQLVFVDDDNILATKYLSEVAQLSLEFPTIAVWSGDISPEFEKTPPEWTKLYWPFLALRSVTRDIWSNSYTSEALPIGAGMTVRREVAEEYVRQLGNAEGRRLLDRRGSSLLAGGDTDIGYTALDLGFGCGITKRLRLSHLIPIARLEQNYLVNLAKSVTYSHVLLSLTRGITQYSTAELRRYQLRYLWYLFSLRGHQQKFRCAIATGRIKALENFSRGQLCLKTGITVTC